VLSQESLGQAHRSTRSRRTVLAGHP